MKPKVKYIRDNFQNYKPYQLPKAQLVIADIPYNVGNNAYGSNPMWYNKGQISNGQSEVAGKKFFNTDETFNVAEFMHFCSKMLVKEPKERGKAPAMFLFCSFEQQMPLIELANRYGFANYINLVFRKNYSPQVLKANMRIVGNCEYGLLFYRDRLPKFNNNGKMVFNCMDWEKDDNYGFAQWVENNKDELLKLGPGRHFGEWWGAGVQRRYDMQEKRFSLFNVKRWSNETLPECCSVVPVLYEGVFSTDAVDRAIDMLRADGSVAAPGFRDPEGIIVFLKSSNNLFKVLLENDDKHKGELGLS